MKNIAIVKYSFYPINKTCLKEAALPPCLKRLTTFNLSKHTHEF